MMDVDACYSSVLELTEVLMLEASCPLALHFMAKKSLSESSTSSPLATALSPGVSGADFAMKCVSLLLCQQDRPLLTAWRVLPCEVLVVLVFSLLVHNLVLLPLLIIIRILHEY
jgi:hypothetical protein